MLLSFLWSFFLLFVGLPWIVSRFHDEDDSWTDRLFICLIHSSFFFIVVIHLFAAIKLYETLSLLFATVAGLFAAYRLYAGRKEIGLGTSLLMSIYDITDRPENWKLFLQGLQTKTQARAKEVWLRTTRFLRSHWAVWALLAVTLGYAAYVRFKHSIVHLYFGSSDAYVHMQLSKYLSVNDLYGDGIYPYGFPAVISAINKFFSLDTYVVMRFIGPLGGVLLVLSVYFAVRKIVGNNYPAILLAIFMYTIYAGLPSNVGRQISALSMEYATIYLLPGIALLIAYFRHKRSVHLLLAGECLALTVIIHPYTAVTLGLAYIVICAVYVRTIFREKLLGKFMAVMTTAGVVGTLPVAVAILASGYANTDYVTDSMEGAELAELTGMVSVLLGEDTLLLGMLAVALLLGVYRLALPWLKRGNDSAAKTLDPGAVSLVGIFLLFYVMYKSGSFGLPVLIPADRFGVYFALVAAAALGVLAHQLFSLVPRERWRAWTQNAAICVLAGAVLTGGNVITAPEGGRLQYDDSVKMYLQIKRDFPSLDWTIVSPMEENPFVKGYGWHMQLWEFAKAIDDPVGKELKIPTSHVFIFVEKIPLGSDAPVTEEEAALPFPVYEGTNTTDFYYRQIENRRILQSKMFKWAENHIKYRPMKVYYDSPVLRVYWIEQDGLNPYDLLK